MHFIWKTENALNNTEAIEQYAETLKMFVGLQSHYVPYMPLYSLWIVWCLIGLLADELPGLLVSPGAIVWQQKVHETLVLLEMQRANRTNTRNISL